MTSVNRSSRNTTEKKKPQIDSHHAALQGARSAFPGSSPNVRPTQNLVSQKSSAALAAAKAGVDARKLALNRSLATADASFASITAHARNEASGRNSAASTVPRNSYPSRSPLSSPRPALSPLPILPPSSSKMAAGISASKVPSQGLARHQSIASPLLHPTRASLPPGEVETKKEMPVQGTVEDVKKWLKSLDIPSESSTGDVVVGIESGSSSHSTTQASRAVPEPITIYAVSKDKPVIQSPKPLRTMTGISVLEPNNNITLDPTETPAGAEYSVQRGEENIVSSKRQPRKPSKSPAKQVSSQKRPNHFQVSTGRTNDSPDGVAERKADAKPVASSTNAGATIKQPAPPPPRRSKNQAMAPPSLPMIRHPTASSTEDVPDLPVRPPPANRYSPSPLPNGRPQIQKRGSSNALAPLHHDASSQRIASRMTDDSLANAIVGAHMATSRASSRPPSPSKSPAPVLPRRHTEKQSFLSHFKHHTATNESRTPSPYKGFRQTMRKERDESDNEEEDDVHLHRRGKGRAATFGIRKHPNKHNEGNRKRWRDIVTERERRRYEGVWAANRGIFVTLTDEERRAGSGKVDPSELVGALVVRDIWLRSRLPAAVLEEVWELVDGEGKGRLTRVEFVVGLWLVDQRLKGRKLPIKVGDSVWRSVRGVYGLKVPK